ncbi:MAG: hypothetical protein EOM24_00775 [Chloroflexia bacterium]|nr:hypothetical protein [Chloroflexia bacterium]
MEDESMGPNWRAAAEAEYARLLDEIEWMESELADNQATGDPGYYFELQDQLEFSLQALARMEDSLGLL